VGWEEVCVTSAWMVQEESKRCSVVPPVVVLRDNLPYRPYGQSEEYGVTCVSGLVVVMSVRLYLCS